ncbi:hypothetical protein NDU88_002043 [Pleurodeles waltl]|uniref:Uncharacterized protein n=1 Tax=Pleurodeles waltl TaxID=8319 RepID=A0AAV7M720_PLEWA|nr:hypothetical protein NDU88_002043 [Pleurodeles waltl]
MSMRHGTQRRAEKPLPILRMPAKIVCKRRQPQQQRQRLLRLRTFFEPENCCESVIKRVIHDVIAAVAGLAEIVRALPHALKISMAPKTTQNSGDMSDGSKMTRIGRDKGDLAGVNRRPHRRQANQSGKICLAQGKTPRPVTTPPPCWRQGSQDLSGALDNSTVIRKKERGTLAGKEQPQAQRSEDQTRVGVASAPSATSGIEEWQNVPPNPKGWDKITEKDLKTSDWAKDSSNTFYSLTEESDLSSGEHSFS